MNSQQPMTLQAFAMCQELVAEKTFPGLNLQCAAKKSIMDTNEKDSLQFKVSEDYNKWMMVIIHQ